MDIIVPHQDFCGTLQLSDSVATLSLKRGALKGGGICNDSQVKDRDQMSTAGHSAVNVIPCSRTQLGTDELDQF